MEDINDIYNRYKSFSKITSIISLKEFEVLYDLIENSEDDIKNKYLKSFKEIDKSPKNIKNIIKEIEEFYNYTFKDDISTDEEQSEEESEEEKNEDQHDENQQFENIDTLNNFYHDNQKMAINNQRKQEFKSGIHAQIMGAGKSYIILQTISDLFNRDIYRYNNENNIVLLITYRQEVLRNWFFKKNNETYVKNIEEYKKWKDLGIIDLNDYEVIDAINDKNKNRFNELNNKRKTLIIINTTFFNLIPLEHLKNRLKAIIIDECHCISQIKFTETLRKVKTNNLPIIGFSATPMRDSKKSIEHLKEFFGENQILNIISSYTLMDAIGDNIILPFKYHLVNSVSNRKYEVFDKIFNDIYPDLVYKKISAWTRTNGSLVNWHNYIKPHYKDLKLYTNSTFNHLKDFEHTPKDFQKFKEEPEKSMMLCINMFKEGTDVPDLDCGIYLDPVKHRTFIVSLQTAGRVLRLDKKYPENKKKFGTIIDFYINDKGEKKAEELTVNKIINYYQSLIHLTDNITEKEKIEELKKFIDKTEFNPEEKKITLKIDDNPEHNCEFIIEKSTIDWTKFADLYKKKINNILKISEEEALLNDFNELKEFIKDENENRQNKINGNLTIREAIKYVLTKYGSLKRKEICNKIDESQLCKELYKKFEEKNCTLNECIKFVLDRMLSKETIYKHDKIYSYNGTIKFDIIDTKEKYIKYGEYAEYELEPEVKFKTLWTNWYDFLGIDTSIFPQTKEEWIQICIENKLNSTNYKNKCYELNLPVMPEEIYEGNNLIFLEENKNNYDNGDNI